eukprot:TRINITY_DN2379_c0_g1_i1.p3 TRINITY_DN2379_c0_g1~~TRINITY_DN2379_c0_g1_i1.p3  ORF type:complete len:78 (-),score=6.08 TRINITY_DN2379_c0_g1_i1:59-292(-)
MPPEWHTGKWPASGNLHTWQRGTGWGSSEAQFVCLLMSVVADFSTYSLVKGSRSLGGSHHSDSRIQASKHEGKRVLP